MWKKREKNGDMMRFCLLCNANEKGRNVGNIPLFREIQICQSHKGKCGGMLRLQLLSCLLRGGRDGLRRFSVPQRPPPCVRSIA